MKLFKCISKNYFTITYNKIYKVTKIENDLIYIEANNDNVPIALSINTFKEVKASEHILRVLYENNA